MKKWIPFIAVLFLLTSCLEFDEVKFKGIESVKLPKFDEKEMILDLVLRIENPNNYKIKIKPSKLDVYIGGTKMGIVHLDEKVVLKKKQENIYATQLKFKLEAGVFFTLFKLATLKEISLGLKGQIKGSVYGISKKVNVDETKAIDPAILKLLLK